MKRLQSAPHRVAAAPARVQTVSGYGSGFSRAEGLSSTARGYGQDWRRVRERILAAEPLCRFCAADGRVTAATDVDHIEPFTGLRDPRRLDPSNLRPLCRPCHMSRTAAQANRADG